MNVTGAKQLSQGVYQLPMADNSSIVVSLVDYFRNFIKTESGITADTQGQSDEKVLGIAQINLGQVADRIGLTNKLYRQCWAELGDIYLTGLEQHMKEKRMIRIIGEHGVEWHDWAAEDFKFKEHPDVRITGGDSEMKQNEKKQAQQMEALQFVAKAYPQTLNPRRAAEKLLSIGQFDPDDIESIMDAGSEGSEAEDVEGARAIKAIMLGKPYPVFQGATPRFISKIITYSRMEVKDQKKRFQLLSYANKHRAIVQRNMKQKATEAVSQMTRAAAGLNQGGEDDESPTPPTPNAPTAPVAPTAPTPPTPPATDNNPDNQQQ